jgi:hypothetical protein
MRTVEENDEQGVLDGLAGDKEGHVEPTGDVGVTRRYELLPKNGLGRRGGGAEQARINGNHPPAQGDQTVR